MSTTVRGAVSQAGSPMDAMRLEDVLEHVNVPSDVLDARGVVRWVNAAARNLVGNVQGRHFTGIVAPEETLRARERFARNVVGSVKVTDGSMVVVDPAGNRVTVEVSSVPLYHGEHVVGVFGQVSDLVEEPHEHTQLPLTPRQMQVLELLERGRTTSQIASDLHLSTETVRNHIRNLLRALGAHSRLEAVAIASGVY